MKKPFSLPEIDVIRLKTISIIATSTGATGEDAPWESTKSYYYDNDEEF